MNKYLKNNYSAGAINSFKEDNGWNEPYEYAKDDKILMTKLKNMQKEQLETILEIRHGNTILYTNKNFSVFFDDL